VDHDRFDDAVRSLAAGPSRRALVGRVAAVLLAGAGVALPAAEGAARRKKKCRGCPTCKECVRGRCRPVPGGTACGGVCQECQGGKCVNKADDSDCNTDGRCLAGVCNSEPTCVSAGVGIGTCPNPSFECCSDECEVGEFGAVCSQGEAGTRCKIDNDCTSASCVGYVCT
jgi:hypothetical protein